MAYSPLPLAAVVIHITLISFKLSGATGVKVMVALLVNLFLLKVSVELSTKNDLSSKNQVILYGGTICTGDFVV